VSSVGGQSAANIAAATLLANSANSANILNTIVRRDLSGNFSAGTITADLTGNATTATTAQALSAQYIDWDAASGPASIANKPSAINEFTMDANSQNITSIADPVNDQDAATKAYVDELEDKVTAMENILIDLGLYTVSDADGNSYDVVKIGTQVWMTENLKTTKYNDSTSIPFVTGNDTWKVLTTPAYCWYNDNEATYKATYGALYNWHAVETGNLCPNGWHVPTNDEWTSLWTYLGGFSVAGGKLKEMGTTHWLTPNTGATNETGFTALPGGERSSGIGNFSNITLKGTWWTSTERVANQHAWMHRISYDSGSMSYGDADQNYGFSVRCIKN
jgi:uncharacterized protein (TIGR02145 family)